jgi:hypothetical protein
MPVRGSDPSQWICTRRFVADAQGKRKFATVRIGRPEKSRRDWACKLSITGRKAPLLVYGVDQMQAVILALECARSILGTSRTKWRWIHGEQGDLGIPRSVPTAFGRKFASRLESIIDAEVEKLALASERRQRRNLAKRPQGPSSNDV